MKPFDVLILGGGASALFCASHLFSLRLGIIESNPKPLQKLLISGGGKCNFTNRSLSAGHYKGDHEFIKACFECFDNVHLLQYLKQFGFEYEVRNKTQLFCKQSAQEIASILLSQTQHTEFFLSQKIESVCYKAGFFEVKTNMQTFLSRKIVLALGGMSYKKIGASDVGYTVATSFGHQINTPKPALVGFTLQKEHEWMKELSGVCFKAKIKVQNKEFVGDLLFTHRGISGPVVLNASVYWEKGALQIDCIPRQKLPKRFLQLFLQNHTKQELSNFSISPSGTFGFEKAEVTRGGICTDEINPVSFESKKQKGLYCIGEILDVTGELGGYNFQWAFSSAYCCAKALQGDFMQNNT